VFRPIKTKRVYEQVAEQIQAHIRAGNLRPGDRLVSERELADLLQVSRAAVREALSALEFVGVVESRQGEGTFVAEVSEHAFAEHLALLLAFERRTSLDMLEMRKILEVAAVELAAQRADRHDLEKIEYALLQMQRDLARDVLGEENDGLFHRAIVEAARNTMLSKTMSLIYDLVVHNMRTSRQHLFHNPHNRQLLYEQHQNVFNAVRRSDSAGARLAMIAHLEFVEAELLRDEISRSDADSTA